MEKDRVKQSLVKLSELGGDLPANIVEEGEDLQRWAQGYISTRLVT